MDAIRWQGDSLALLDQTKLPVEEVWEDYTDYRKVADAIRRLVVRGAPAIGVAAAFSSAQLALSGVMCLVPFDQVVHAMSEVGHALPASLRETARGGLAATPAACAACGACG